MPVVGEPRRKAGRERGQRIRPRGCPPAGPALPGQAGTDGLTVAAKVTGDRRNRPPASCQSMNLHVFSLGEHRAGAPPDDGLDTVRLEGAPPLSADVTDDTPRLINWGESAIEHRDFPGIADRIRHHIDELFAQDRPLPEILEEVARLGAQLLIQAALEAEVTEFLGRDRYQRPHAARMPGPAPATGTGR